MNQTKNEFSKTVRIQVQPLAALTKQEQELLQAAVNVRLNAQAPYSKFSVGVAILSNKNTMHLGCNVERCSWTQTTHAEQNAVDSMIAQYGPAKIELIAVAAAPQGTSLTLNPEHHALIPTSADSAKLCCAHCLQIIWENCFQDSSVKIISLTPDGYAFTTTIGDMLPMPFGPEHLGINYAAPKNVVT